MMKLIASSTLYDSSHLKPRQREIRDLALNRFEAFISLVAPYQLLGSCHKALSHWIEQNESENKLILWPRDHGKSRFAAFYTAWQICRNPAVTIIYGSATAEKAEEQLRFIKNILSSPVVRKYFPGLVNEKEGHRTAWNATNIIVDHPLRMSEGVIDSTVMTCGLEKTITGKHCAVLVLDDIVVPENNTIQGRKIVNSWVAQAASITSADSHIFAVGTRYHPKDAYNVMVSMVYRVEREDGEFDESKALFMVNQSDVEADGEYLWPRQQRKDGAWFGFNPEILARKRAVYEANGEITQFYAQYYNDPNDRSTAPISRDMFQYYDRSQLEFSYGSWELDGKPLYTYLSVDLAATVGEASDFSVLCVGAIDTLGNRYVIHIDRFKTDKMSVVQQRIAELYNKYVFKKGRIEAVGGFRLVAQDLADRLQDKGIRIPWDLYIPPNYDGKIARIHAILEPLYQSGAVYHYRGGNTQVLEDELVSINPAHDDAKDAWAMCCDLMEMPRQRLHRNQNIVQFNSRFGGVSL